jgi:hypothetical protein
VGIHFDWTITLSGIATFCSVVVLILRMETWGRKIFTEHEILIRDYCERKGIKLRDLPTRLKLGGT